MIIKKKKNIQPEVLEENSIELPLDQGDDLPEMAEDYAAEETGQEDESLEKDITEIAGLKVLKFKDIQKDIEKNMKNGKITKTGLPISNVLYYELENNNWCCVRPSGTAPKIKLYMGVKARSEKKATEKLELLKEAMVKVVTE